VLKHLKKYLIPSTHRKMKVQGDREASFRLMLDNLEIGTLDYNAGKWLYQYSDEFKSSAKIRPLAGFPELNKIYISEELWPFFTSRIPSLSRERVRKVIDEEGIKENDLLALLDRFGRRTITNPFELLSVDKL